MEEGPAANHSSPFSATRGENRYPDFPESAVRLEAEALGAWREEDLFGQTLEATDGAEEFVFYEGPPTANGRPGLHHVLSRTIKDLICRYHAMRGRHVTRIAGWDTHGLPVEIEAEKKLGISGKREIEEAGVERFNRVCRDSVFTYKEEWERLSERIGYWLDYSRPYVTFAPEYIESVWNLLKRLDERELLYRGHKSVPFCPRCGTALSSHEVAQGYEEVMDPSLHFLCPILAPDGGADPDERAFLVWTTTPWTLPANVALAVNPELTYVEVEYEGRRVILAEDRLEAVVGENAEPTRRYTAEELVGLSYQRPFELVPKPPAEKTAGGRAAGANGSGTAWHVIAESFVSAEEGTGIVHLAPAFGSDDYEAGQRHDLPLMRPIGDDGRFAEEIPLVGGLFVKAADEILVEDLAERDLLFRHSLEKHSYPHCWRCSSPLIYMARDSWYIRTTALKEEMLANNRQVDWHPPEVGTGRFGEWLEGNVDWALSRDRYWGTPLPIWQCDTHDAHVMVIGSFTELAECAGGLPDDFDPHKPWIDALAWPCADCGGTMRRTPEVIDVWFDSGAMPYAQWHYPFENEEAWRRHFPADFICEGVDQTRGWFYSMMAIATMLGDGPPYRNVIVNDLLLDEEGRKMSKSRGNTVDPWDAIEEFGADAIRWYFMTVSQPWVPKRFDPAALAEDARRIFDTLVNAYRFFALYANIDDWSRAGNDPAPAERHVMDRWVLSRLNGLVASVRAALEAYDITRAGRAIGDFIVDDLSNWYIRRSRGRFWGGGNGADGAGPQQGSRGAFRTLADTLAVVTKLMAPFTPFQADWLYRAVAERGSVHLPPFPEAKQQLRDETLEAEMEIARTLSRLGRAARESAGIRVRQPLGAVHAVVPGARPVSAEVLDVVREELNIKRVRFLTDETELVTLRAKPNFAAIGPRFGGRTNAVAEAVRQIPAERLAEWSGAEPLTVNVEGETVDLDADAMELRREPRGGLLVESDQGYTVALDPTVDEALRREGLARELVNRIQGLRRDSGLEVEDRIRLSISGDETVLDAARAFTDYIARETLAREVRVERADDDAASPEARPVQIDDMSARIGIFAA